MHLRTTASLLLLGTVSACRLGPDHAPVEPEVAERFVEASASGAGEPGAPDGRDDSVDATTVVDAWWETFDDPVLRTCVEETFARNHDIRASLESLRALRALRDVESSAYWPTVDASAAFTRDRISENNPRFESAIDQGLFDRDVQSWDVGFDVGWELDLFGEIRRRVEGASAELRAREYERGALMLSIAAEVARDYFELRANQDQLRILDAALATEGERVAILERKERGGIVSADDVLRARATVETLRASRPRVEAELRTGEYRLAVAMGRRPEDGVPEVREPRALPTVAGRVPVGLPSELLRRRPDVLAAERRVAAACAEIGIATADYFPRFYLTGSPFLQAGDFGDLFRASSSGWLFGPRVSWSVFSAGRTSARVEAAKARHAESLLAYESTVGRVLEEVESSLARYGKGVESLRALASALELERERVALAARRDDAGIGARLDVLALRSRALDTESRYAERHLAALVQLVALHKALGGGWADAEAFARAAARDEERAHEENDAPATGEDA